MNFEFKKVALAAAVGAVGAGVAQLSSAQMTSGEDLNRGDLALVPYYNAVDGNKTGVHITNTTDMTQAVKVRLREHQESLDVLDFNIVMSPEDMFTFLIREAEESDLPSGYESLAGNVLVAISNGEDTCTVPVVPNNKLVSTLVSGERGLSGYVEVIAMGETDAMHGDVHNAALHGEYMVDNDVDWRPADCDFVEDNFLRNWDGNSSYSALTGVLDTNLTRGVGGTADNDTTWFDSDDSALMVSWFIREDANGWEVGGDAVHISGFLDVPSISNQSEPIEGQGQKADALGYDYPDLNGPSQRLTVTDDNDGVGNQTARQGYYTDLAAILQRAAVHNDWAYRVADGDSVTADWVVTFPGQYTMCEDTRDTHANGGKGVSLVEYTNGVATSYAFSVLDREEVPLAPGTVTNPDGIVVSPAPPPSENVFDETFFNYEVNLFRFSNSSEEIDGAFSGVSARVLQVPTNPETDDDATAGWATINLTGNSSKMVCDHRAYAPATKSNTLFVGDTAYTAQNVDGDNVNIGTNIPAIGFAAWKKVRNDQPAANYGRAVEHSWSSM